MSEPILQIMTMEIKDGRLDDFKESVKKSVTFVRENGPQLLVEVYIDEEHLRAHSFQIQPDSESIISHWQMTDPYIREVNKHMTPMRLDIYGQPNKIVMKSLQQFEKEGVIVTVTPHFYGFHRLLSID
ncbi:hypothetical protein [Alteribacillus sp. HJP-4]|uniref:hypothetical protein n=1 Tax=Alteribacillus sp. HJP-4 TaxID=2775394 RepID=UPI0035CCF497